MSVIKYTTNADHSIKSPEFGDAEIREIVFDYPNATLKIYVPFESRVVSFVLENISFFSFITDHSQNIIGRVYVYPSVKDMRQGREQFVEQLAQNNVRIIEKKIVAIEPLQDRRCVVPVRI